MSTLRNDIAELRAAMKEGDVLRFLKHGYDQLNRVLSAAESTLPKTMKKWAVTAISKGMFVYDLPPSNNAFWPYPKKADSLRFAKELLDEGYTNVSVTEIEVEVK